MKKIIIVFLAAVFAAMSLGAQENPMLQQLPGDPAVRVGHLENGLTYYIRHNELPKDRAEFYLATKAGGIFETPDQDGLAHFLEHMCFNGTERFPGKGILNYLQSIGAEFGRNINASTGFEETQYMLNNIPVERPSVADSCILILSEYAHYVLNSSEEIDLERPVIIEERRTRRNAQWRTLEASLPYYFGNTKYATCTLIGSEENLKSFKPESLHDFYATWYHPGRQAVVVVGDVDVDRIEAKIKEYFGRIPKNENPQADPVIDFPANREPVVGILTDPEITAPGISLIWKSEAEPESINSTLMGEFEDVVKIAIAMIMRERFADITSKPDSPFLGGSFYLDDLIYERIDAASGDVTLREDDIMGGFKAYYAELERMRRFGFTTAEFGRVKTNLLSMEEAMVQRAATRKNDELVRPLLSNFFDNETYMEPATEKQVIEAILDQIDVQVINQVASQLMTEENFVALYTGPQKEGVATPSKEDILNAIAEVKASDIKPLEAEVITSDFMGGTVLKGSAVKKTGNGYYGSAKWTLNNGVEVYLLPTDYRKDQIAFNLWREGGESLISTEDLQSFENNIWGLFLENTGVAGFSGTQLSKMLTGKNVNVGPYIGNLTNGIQGSSTKKDLETALQLTYLYYMQPRFDAEEYGVGLSQLRSMLPSYMENPKYKLQKALVETLYGGNPRKVVIAPTTLEKANIATVEKNYRMLFNGTKGLRFTIVGDFNPEEARPLIEKYIGSIRKGGKSLAWKDNDEDFVKGEVKVQSPIKMETPLSTAVITYHAPMEYIQSNRAALKAISYILDMRYTATLREEIGGTYGASTNAMFSDMPKKKGGIQVSFSCKPELCDTLVNTAEAIFEKLAEEGPTDEEFSMTLLNLKKNIPESRLSNGYWMSLINDYLMNPVETDKAYEDAVNKLTASDVKNVAATLIASGNMIEFVQIPE